MPCRPDTNSLRDSLKALGATVVVTNSESAAYGEPMPQLFEVGTHFNISLKSFGNVFLFRDTVGLSWV